MRFLAGLVFAALVVCSGPFCMADDKESKPKKGSTKKRVIELPKNVPGWVSGEVKNLKDIEFEIPDGKGGDGKGGDGKGGDGKGGDGKGGDGKSLDDPQFGPSLFFNQGLQEGHDPLEAHKEFIQNIAEEIASKTADAAGNEQAVKKWVNGKIHEAVMRSKIPPEQKGIIITIEQALEKESKLIVMGGKSASVLIDLLGVWNRHEASLEVQEAARRGDAYGAWEVSVTQLIGEIKIVGIVAPYVGPIVAEATVDIYVPMGNSIAHWMWENGYSPLPPRFPKNHFDGGVPRPPRLQGDVVPVIPTVPAVPNGLPGESSPDVQPKGPIVIVPPVAVPLPSTPFGEREQAEATAAAIPVVPLIIPVPLPPPRFPLNR